MAARRKWSESELARAQLEHSRGRPLAEIAAGLGRTVQAVANKLLKARREKRPRRKGDLADYESKVLARVLEERGWTCTPPGRDPHWREPMVQQSAPEQFFTF